MKEAQHQQGLPVLNQYSALNLLLQPRIWC